MCLHDYVILLSCVHRNTGDKVMLKLVSDQEFIDLPFTPAFIAKLRLAGLAKVDENGNVSIDSEFLEEMKAYVTQGIEDYCKSKENP